MTSLELTAPCPTEAPFADEIGLMPLEGLEDEIGELCAHINAATCRWLCLVAEFDRREGHLKRGFHTCSGWLSWHCSLAPGAAREQVRVARRLAEMPLVRECFSRGELSYSKVRAISRVADPGTEADLVELARHATAAQMERLVGGYRGAIAADGEAARRAYQERFISWQWDDDGSLVLRGRLPAEDGALLLTALETARDRIYESARELASASVDVSAETPASGGGDRAGVPQDGRNVSAETFGPSATSPSSPSESPAELEEDPLTVSVAASNADALALMAETLLSADPKQRSGGDRYQIVVHADIGALSDGAPEGRCEIEDGPALSREVARRLACDASLVSILERGGTPLSVGRKTRSIPPALRRALRSRDGGCQFPGCGQRRFVDAHHIHHWAEGGETDLSNLLLLCRHHHRLMHEGGYRVEREAHRGLVFRRPDGKAIPVVPPARRGNRREVGRWARRLNPASGPTTCVPLSRGEPLDYDLAVMGLCARTREPVAG